MPTTEDYAEAAFVTVVGCAASYYGFVRLLSRNVGLHNNDNVRFAAVLNGLRYGAMAGLMAMTYRDAWPLSIGVVALTIYNHAVDNVRY